MTTQSALDTWRHLGAPALVAHRGDALRFPENTIVSLAAAVACGARFLEFDIQVSRDGIPILWHDPDLQRVANRPERVFDLDWKDLREVHAAESARFGSRFQLLPLSSLENTLEHLSTWPQTTSFVEIKRQSATHFGIERVVAGVLDKLTRARWPFVVISFNADVVTCAQRHGCRQTGWVVQDWNDEQRDLLTQIEPDYVFCNANKIPDGDPLWPGHWHWVIYEVRKAAEAIYWRSRGASLIESMAPAQLLNAAPFTSSPDVSV